MSLEYLRQNAISGLDDIELPAAKPKRPPRKFFVKKFAVLLSGNLIVWSFFLVSVLDIDVHSMTGISVPHIPHKLAVTGIIYNDQKPTAIISNQVYTIGDIVDGYIIQDITRTEVQFEKDGKVVTRQMR